MPIIPGIIPGIMFIMPGIIGMPICGIMPGIIGMPICGIIPGIIGMPICGIIPGIIPGMGMLEPIIPGIIDP